MTSRACSQPMQAHESRARGLQPASGAYSHVSSPAVSPLSLAAGKGTPIQPRGSERLTGLFDMPGLFDFTRTRPVVSPETVQAHVSAVQQVQAAKARRNDGAQGMACERARVEFTRRLAAELGKESPL